ncbi:hypothetical protein ID866_10799 [Astraeus odoratus]|nr:hypothetical protein ID866_10799 [Astraeus odoratus]
MSSGNKNVESVNWQEVPEIKLGWDEANPEDVTMAKLQEKFQHKRAEEAMKRAHKAEAWHQEAAVVERQREAEQQREAKKQEAERAKEAKKQQCAKSEARPSGAQGQESKCVWCAKAGAVCVMGLGMKRKMACNWCSCNKEKCEWPVTEIGSMCGMTSPQGGKKKKRMRRVQPIFDDDNDDDNDIVVMSTCKARKSESRAWEMMAQVVDRRMGEVVKELWGLRKGVATMAKSNWDLAQVLYHGFQSVDTLVNKVQIFGAEGFLPKLAPESEPAKDKLQETLREVEELQEEHLEWEMEHLQMRKEWMGQEEAALTKCLKGKGKELAREEEQEGEEQEEEEQRTRGEEGEGATA